MSRCGEHQLNFGGIFCPECVNRYFVAAGSTWESLPAKAPTLADTSPPSRTSSAASANGAASLLAKWLLPRFEELIGGFDLLLPSDIEKRDEILYVLTRTIESQRIEVSGVERDRTKRPNGDTLCNEHKPGTPGASLRTEAGVATCLTSSLDTAKARSADANNFECIACEWSGSAADTVHPKHDPEFKCCPECRERAYPFPLPLPEPAIRAAVYGCTDAQCVCGRCAPVRAAIDPWQGLGKTWKS